MSQRTEAQREAARLNGAKSQGPITPKGKAISSRNSLKHGLSSKKFILEDEDQAEFDALHADYLADFAPATRIERDLVRQLAIYQFRLDRAIELSIAACDCECLTQDERLTAEFDNPDDDLITSSAVIAQHRSGEAGAFFRYESHYSRLFNRTLKNLRALQNDRRKREREAAPAVPAQPAAAQRLYSINQAIDAGHIPSLRPSRPIASLLQNEPDDRSPIPLQDTPGDAAA